MINPGAILLIINLFRTLSERSKRRWEQLQRDRLAQQIARGRLIPENLSGHNPLPFALYLRPYAMEEMFREYVEDPLIFVHEVVNFDFILQTHFKALGTLLISIGAPNDKKVSGHVQASELSWRDSFRQSAELATKIVVVPGIQDSIMAEIRWLKITGKLAKSVFFKPAGYPESRWQQTRDVFRNNEGIELPPYSNYQLSFRVNPYGRHYDLLEWKPFQVWIDWRGRRAKADAEMREFLSKTPHWEPPRQSNSISDEKIKSAYDTLGIPIGASSKRVAIAYHKMAKMYHPDKLGNLAPEFIKLAEEKMKEINAAYEILKT